ncbi:MAG: flagellin N-terminal helical domain-containing protein [bacterium]
MFQFESLLFASPFQTESRTRNCTAFGSIRSLRGAQSAIAQSSTRLASGLRINSAADDAGGLAVSERFRGDTASLGRGQLKTAHGIGSAESAQAALAKSQTCCLKRGSSPFNPPLAASLDRREAHSTANSRQPSQTSTPSRPQSASAPSIP